VTGARWLVDGMNLIGSRPDRWWRDREGAWRRLADELEKFARDSGDEVSLVIDGRRPADWPEGGAVETSFAAGRRGAADEAIVTRVEADPHPEQLRVVTSDRELAHRVSELGAQVVSAGAFRERLERG
jgi:predicted RNA-binding protein with PIN domain